MKLRIEMRGAGRDWRVYPWMSDENGVEWTPADQDGMTHGIMLLCCETYWGAKIFGEWDGEEITINSHFPSWVHMINEYIQEVIRLREGGQKHQESRPSPSKFELYRAGIPSDLND